VTGSVHHAIRVLFIAASDDVEPLLAGLRDAGLEVGSLVVRDEGELRAALASETWSVIVCAEEAAGLSGHDALRIVQANAPATPFVLVSRSGGEAAAVEAMRAGAQDFVLAGDRPRLVTAVQRAIEEADSRPGDAAIAQNLEFLREVRDYAIFVLSPDGCVWTWNDGAHLIKGYTAEEIVGRSFECFYTAEDRANGKPAAMLRRAAAEGRAEEESWRVRQDGTRFWASVVITAVHERDGRLRGFVKVTRDLTERRRQDELVRQSEERLRLLVESVKDYAIFMLDPQGHVATWNSGAQNIKGYRREDVLGKHFSIFYPPEDVELGRPERELEIAISEGRYEEEAWRVRKNGERFLANVVITAVFDDAKRLRGFAKITRDLTELRRIQEEANEAYLAVKSRDEFISVAAHELRTPLTALQLKLQGVDRALKRADSGPGHELASRLADRIDGALRQVERLGALVERLLDVSSIVGGTLQLELEELDLLEIVERVVEDLREPAQQVGSELRIHGPSGVAGVWDRARIEQVLINLLSNAIKYGAGKPIDVTVQGAADAVRILVSDQGIGIAADDTDRIFTRFERAVPVRHYGGLGLGLYITRHIVEAHGGSIKVSSRAGQGSTFIIELPRRATLRDAATDGAESAQ